jgi:hypothetical protein
MGFLEEAEKALQDDTKEEDRSDWIQASRPENYPYKLHPPALSREHGIFFCRCNSIGLKLVKLYKNRFLFWCLRCGPKEDMTEYNK